MTSKNSQQMLAILLALALMSVNEALSCFGRGGLFIAVAN
ncbi:hypothetical protein SPWS13_1794 [Shewanella putrefaciens]|nr:hypothetical protein SPWS13_1794 [Shewanella putrefaciens]